MAQVPKKRKKATYLRRKEEHDALTDQVLALQAQLEELQVRLDEKNAENYKAADAVALNGLLDKMLQENSLRMATTQSLLSEWMQNISSNPMGVHIHLKTEWAERRDTLLKMKGERLEYGFRYVSARCRHLSPLKPHKSEEHFEDANGDFCCVSTEVIPFPGISSMRKVFDTIKYGVNTLEISISEESGDITVREDYDTVDDDSFVSNYRLTSTNEGSTTELNTVAFGQYVVNSQSFEGQPYAVFAFDSVNQDDVHPYRPLECVRKDINGTIVAIPVTRKKKNEENSTEEEETMVVILRSFFFRTHRPQANVAETSIHTLRSSVTRWGEIYVKELQRMLYS